tara:strand:+ start:3275 stop:4609 length:1335 start_codon:yes stop_codon:yes gene_type:complete
MEDLQPVEEFLASDDLLFHFLSSSFRQLDPCWCYPYRTTSSARPSPALHIGLLLRLRLVCRKWRALICEVAHLRGRHAAVDLSGCRPPAWLPPSALSGVRSLLLADVAPRTLSLLQGSDSALSSLTALSLRGSRTLTDSSIARLLHAAQPRLVALSLSGCVQAAAETYAVFSCGAQPLLRELDLSCGAIGYLHGFVDLAQLQWLRRLDLSDNRLGAGETCSGSAVSTVVPRLDELGLDACGLHDGGLAWWLAHASRLQTLSLADCRPSAAGLLLIGRLAPALTWLNLSDSDVLHGHVGGSEAERQQQPLSAAEALSSLPPTLRTLRVLSCGWLSHHDVWCLEQQGCAVVHDTPAAPSDDRGAMQEAMGTDAAVDDWEDLLSETCDAVRALKLPEGAPRPSHAPPRADAVYESLAAKAAGSHRKQPESCFRVSLGKAGTGAWRAR